MRGEVIGKLEREKCGTEGVGNVSLRVARPPSSPRGCDRDFPKLEMIGSGKFFGNCRHVLPRECPEKPHERLFPPLRRKVDSFTFDLCSPRRDRFPLSEELDRISVRKIDIHCPFLFFDAPRDPRWLLTNASILSSDVPFGAQTMTFPSLTVTDSIFLLLFLSIYSIDAPEFLYCL